MSKISYLPKAYNMLLVWLENFMTYLNENLSRFDIPPDKVVPLQNLMKLFQTAQIKAELPNAGSADRLNRKEKAEAVSKAVRNFVNANLRYNEAVTDEDRVNLGLNVPDPEPTPLPDPKTMPTVYRIDSSVIMRISLYFKDTNSESRAKPDGIQGAEIVYAILDAPPVTTEDLIHSDFSTRSPRTFVFDENQRGKTVWYRLRWENRRGRKGPWSELYSAVIP